MKKGNSGATITMYGDCHVIKSGFKGILEQADLCEALWPVTPRVFKKIKSSGNGEAYSMEVLAELPMTATDGTVIAIDTLRRTRAMLWSMVWSKPYRPVPTTDDWINKLREFIMIFGHPNYQKDYRALLNELFVERPLVSYSMIHGDPTLANTMIRTGPLGTLAMLVICDPIAPKGKIPPHFTVDLGKLLQSALGWETQQFGWRYSIHRCIKTVLEGYDNLERARAWFWCSIHCLRILPYAKGEAHAWAKDRAELCLEHSRGALCSTLSI